jgi:hypothetical protein
MLWAGDEYGKPWLEIAVKPGWRTVARAKGTGLLVGLVLAQTAVKFIERHACGKSATQSPVYAE